MKKEYITEAESENSKVYRFFDEYCAKESFFYKLWQIRENIQTEIRKEDGLKIKNWVLKNKEELEKYDGIKRVIMLNRQYRMHPKMGAFVSNHFYEGKLENRISNYEAKRDKISDENGWSVEETQANEALNEKLDDELTKVYNLIMERLPEGKKVNFRNEQRQWLKIRKRKVENSNNDEDGNSMMGGRAAANVEIMTYQEITKDRLFEFARMYDNMD